MFARCAPLRRRRGRLVEGDRHGHHDHQQRREPGEDQRVDHRPLHEGCKVEVDLDILDRIDLIGEPGRCEGDLPVEQIR